MRATGLAAPTNRLQEARVGRKTARKILEFFSRQPLRKPIKRQKKGDSARQMPLFPRSKKIKKSKKNPCQTPKPSLMPTKT
jgi:hypothetical protein